jgi:phage terminase large subunit-like protein
MDRTKKIELIALLEEKKRRQERQRLRRYYENFYPWQQEFCAATSNHHESCLCSANQIGKTRVGTVIDAVHLTGDYPEDWPGHRYEYAPLCWGLGYSMEKTRDLLQSELFGTFTPQDGFSGGLIPADKIVSHESAQGTSNAMRTVRVKHKSGNISVMQFWSYSQGQHAIMGDKVDWVHVDEEPKDQTIRPQLLTRTINGDNGRGGRIIYTFTPENGRTELVIQFMDEPSSDQFYMQKGWADAPHMTKEKQERLLAQYPEYQRKMRSEGEPMLGHGRIYDIGDDFILCDPFDVPGFWKTIAGMDFGWDHPQAFCKLVLDPDNDIIYVTNSWKASKVSANDAFGATQGWIRNLPVAWPADGLMHEKGRDVATQQKDHYTNAGFSLLADHATWLNGGTSVESGIYEILDRMRKGTFKIVRGQLDLMEEVRQYHRDEKGKIVKVRDDILDSIRYAYMMLRCAKHCGDIGMTPKNIRPPVIKPMGRRAGVGLR